MPPFRRIGILGTGLIGGSFLLALRRLLPDAELVAGAPSEKTREAVRASGAANRVFDPAAEAPAAALAGCDLAVLAAPPRVVCRDLPALKGARIGLVVDVASVKGSVMEAARGLGNFVGGHPMAGTEGVGFGAADPDLFRGAAFLYCVPPDYAAGADRLDALLALLGALGFRCIGMDAAEHDRRLALVSHLPHAAAFALALVAALYPFRHALDRTMMLTIVTAASAPVAAMTTMFAAQYGRDVDLSVGLVSATTLLSIFTMPPVIALAMAVL